MPPWAVYAADNTIRVYAMRAEEVVSGGKDLDSKIPPLGAKGWGTGKSNPSHPSRRRRRVGHPQNLKFNCGMELLAVDEPSVVIRKMQRKKGGPPALLLALTGVK